MCGIFAAMMRRGLTPQRRDTALKSLQHRGPDGSRSWTSRDGRWTLGHTRLSIIGLNNGDQPMTSPDGAVHLIVNGEFYGYREIRDRLRAGGYRFSTESDSEIALHLYDERGLQAASELRGEFAVIIADEQQQAMVAIRDRFGIKPLYYSVVNGDVFFASEIKALLALGVPAAWDVEGAIGGLGRSHETTEFAGISTVPPGCYAIARHGEVRIYSYWDWEIPTAEQLRGDERSEAEVVDEFRDALLDSVRQRLAADVEVACYLSGGIDSCAVLGLAQQSTDRPIRAFTLTFENPLYDEASIAEAQARHAGASYHPIPITGREIADAYADAVWHSETQMFNGHGVAKYPFLDHHVAAAAARVPVNMKVKGIREKHVLREATKDVLIPEVYDRQKHPFTTPPTRAASDPMLSFYRDTFASRAAKDQPIYDMTKVRAALDRLLECPADQRIAMEGGLQRAASVIIMQDKFAMATGSS